MFVGEVLVAEVEVSLRERRSSGSVRRFSGGGVPSMGTTDSPTCPTMLNPVGSSSCSDSGSMALIMSSDGNEQFCSTSYLCLARTYGSSSSRSLIRDCTVRG